MRAITRIAAAAPLAALVAACGASPSPMVDVAAEEAAIRGAERQLLQAAQNLDPAAFAAMFAPDGRLMFPDVPAVVGQAAIQAQAARNFAAPDFAVTWEAEEVTVAASGDLAVSRGAYRLGFTTDGGPIEDRGKYLTVWKKVDGAWRVAADMINSDGDASAAAGG